MAGGVIVNIEQIVTWVLLAVTLVSVLLMRFDLLSMEHRIARIQFKVGDAIRCPVCGHPVITGHFNEGEPYTCLECGEQFIWRLKDGCYQLELALTKKRAPSAIKKEDKKPC